jgi:thiosulfate reductase cytochrome b subunit
MSVRSVWGVVRNHLRLKRPTEAEVWSYNVLQRLYLAVVFVLFPLMVWTGLAMSPAFTGAFPFIVDVLGGFQSARTIHFFTTVSLVLFFLVHLAMVALAGWRTAQSMVTGRIDTFKEVE